MESFVAKVFRDFESGKMNRRQAIHSIMVAATVYAAGDSAALAATTKNGSKPGFKTIAVNHISYQCADYRRTRDFYAGLMGMEVHADHGTQCNLAFGPKEGGAFLLPRNRRLRNPTATPVSTNSQRPPITATIDHVAYTIADWDKVKVEETLKSWGLNPDPDTDNSFHVKDPDGFDLQIAGVKMSGGGRG